MSITNFFLNLSPPLSGLEKRNRKGRVTSSFTSVTAKRGGRGGKPKEEKGESFTRPLGP